jgi:hypothetical protein
MELSSLAGTMLEKDKVEIQDEAPLVTVAPAAAVAPTAPDTAAPTPPPKLKRTTAAEKNSKDLKKLKESLDELLAHQRALDEKAEPSTKRAKTAHENMKKTAEKDVQKVRDKIDELERAIAADKEAEKTAERADDKEKAAEKEATTAAAEEAADKTAGTASAADEPVVLPAGGAARGAAQIDPPRPAGSSTDPPAATVLSETTLAVRAASLAVLPPALRLGRLELAYQWGVKQREELAKGRPPLDGLKKEFGALQKRAAEAIWPLERREDQPRPDGSRVFHLAGTQPQDPIVLSSGEENEDRPSDASDASDASGPPRT